VLEKLQVAAKEKPKQHSRCKNTPTAKTTRKKKQPSS
jgi:hypothetical protein